MTKSQSVLVTGGAGFIGSHLVEDLVSKDHKVTVLDNFSNKQPKMSGAGFEVIKGDVCDLKSVMEVTKAVDVVYHLAAVLGVEYAYQHPTETLEVEIMGTRNVLEGMRKSKSDTDCGDMNRRLEQHARARLLQESIWPEPASPAMPFLQPRKN